MDSRWSPNGQQNRYEDPSKVNCSIHLIAHGLHEHFDIVHERKNGPELVLIPDQCALSIVATKNRDVLRSITFYSRKTCFLLRDSVEVGTQVHNANLKKILYS